MLSAAFSQNFSGDYNSIPVTKLKAKKMIYQFQDTILKEIYLNPKYPNRRPLNSKQARITFGRVPQLFYYQEFSRLILKWTSSGN